MFGPWLLNHYFGSYEPMMIPLSLTTPTTKSTLILSKIRRIPAPSYRAELYRLPPYKTSNTGLNPSHKTALQFSPKTQETEATLGHSSILTTMEPSGTSPLKPAVTVIETCRVSPPPGSPKLTLPLTFFDIIYLDFPLQYHMLFYRFPSCSKSDFLENIVPSLKKSLSQTLKHFLPVSGNLVIPDSEALPEIRFRPGNSVSFTVAESSSDFNYLIGNQPRECDRFYAFLPNELATSDGTEAAESRPLFAVQVTMFPGFGISIGFTYNHTLGDARSIVQFMNAWSSVHTDMFRIGNDNIEELLATNGLLPFYDRSVVKDSSGIAIHLWNQMQRILKEDDEHHPNSDNEVRATYIIHKEDIQRLRNFVLAKRPDLATAHLSPFTISCACIWACLVRSAGEVGEEIDDTEPEYFDIPVDVRSRLDPPTPTSYSGNCVAFALTELTHGEMKGDEGFLVGVESIAQVISKNVNVKGELLRDAGDWLSKYIPLMRKRFFSVTGSPKFDYYDVDFGWGKPRKCETLATDGGQAMSISRAIESEGSLEIQLSLPKKKMDAFAAIFSSLLDHECV